MFIFLFQLSDDPFDGKRIDVSQAPVLVKKKFRKDISETFLNGEKDEQ
jgi:hypothetical protein